MAKIKTVNQLVSVFRDAANRHYQINGFGIGENWEVGASEAKIHPVLWINPVSAVMTASENNIGYKTFEIDFEIRIFDLVNKDESNENEVLSDGIDILKDIITEFKGHPYYTNSQLNIVNDIDFEPFTEEFDEEVTGWVCELSFKTPLINSWCGLPMADIEGFSFPGADCDGYNAVCDATYVEDVIGVYPIEVTQVSGNTKVISIDTSSLTGGGSTSGTFYEYVTANGTDVENAAELQAAYTTAKSKVVTEATPISLVSLTGFDVFDGVIFAFFYEPSLAGVSLTAGQTYTIILDGVEYTGVVVFYGDSDILMSSVTAPNGSYSTMSIVVSTTKKATVVASPGYYNFATDFIADDGNVDIVSLDGNRSVIFNGDGTINVTGDGAYIKGIDVQSKNFTIADDLPNITIVNCKGGNFSFGGDPTFGSNPITVSGTFIDCQGEEHSFAGYGIASGYFERCVSKTGFGTSSTGLASGTFIDCKVHSGDGFGAFTSASGLFVNCDSDLNGVGFGAAGIASGTFINCRGSAAAFGGGGGVCSGVFENCVSRIYGFGQTQGSRVGTLSGKLYYCRLTSGTFQTVSGGGITRYCIDGNDVANNQG